MSYLGSVLTDAAYIDASSTTIEQSSANSTELIAALSKDVSSIFLSSNIAVPFYLTLGPAGSEENWLLVPGYASTVIDIERMPIHASKGMRLGVRAYADSDITSGLLTVNLWS